MSGRVFDVSTLLFLSNATLTIAILVVTSLSIVLSAASKLQMHLKCSTSWSLSFSKFMCIGCPLFLMHCTYWSVITHVGNAVLAVCCLGS